MFKVIFKIKEGRRKSRCDLKRPDRYENNQTEFLEVKNIVN